MHSLETPSPGSSLLLCPSSQGAAVVFTISSSSVVGGERVSAAGVVVVDRVAVEGAEPDVAEVAAVTAVCATICSATNSLT
jgi:hypothetical protein